MSQLSYFQDASYISSDDKKRIEQCIQRVNKPGGFTEMAALEDALHWEKQCVGIVVGVRDISRVLQVFREHVVRGKGVSVRDYQSPPNAPQERRKMVLVDPPSALSSSSTSQTPDETKTSSRLEGLLTELRSLEGVGSVEVVTNIGVPVAFRDLGFERALQSVLPPGVQIPKSFETAGHVAHLNLESAQLPFRHLIAHMLRRFTRRVTCVVNKTGNIKNEFRVFPMEILTHEGQREQATRVCVQEQQCRFEFDFMRVYWNSRLGTEHTRLVTLIVDQHRRGLAQRRSDSSSPSTQAKHPLVVFDMCAGVGPFAVPLAARLRFPKRYAMRHPVVKRSKVSHSTERKSPTHPPVPVTIYANDLNPDSYKHLVHNTQLNKVDRWVHCSNLDGGKALHELTAQWARLLPDRSGDKVASNNESKNGGTIHLPQHAIINLPALGTEFCANFQGALKPARDMVMAFLGVTPEATAANENTPATTSNTTSITTSASANDTKRVDCPESKAESGKLVYRTAELRNFDHLAVGPVSLTVPCGKDDDSVEIVLPVVHCYCFSTECVDPHAEILGRVTKHLGGHAPYLHTLHFVRNVAPAKNMFCFSFVCPLAALLGESNDSAVYEREVDVVTQLHAKQWPPTAEKDQPSSQVGSKRQRNAS